MDKKKMIYSIIFFIILLSVTFYVVFSNIDLNMLTSSLKNMNIKWIIYCILIMILYFLFQGLYMKTLLASMNEKITVKKGMFYSIVEFFFSGVTPSSTGGQPAQMYYMIKDDIPVSKSIITLLLNTIYFKLYLIIMGIIILICNYHFIFTSTTFNILFAIGMTVDFFIILGCYLSMYHANLVRWFVNIFYKIINKIKKKKVKTKDIEAKLENYQKQTEYIKHHKKEVIIGLILTFLQRTCLFSIAYIVYRSLGFNEYTYYQLLIMQISAQIAIEGLPLPGGTGVSEGILNKKFELLFGSALAGTGMLLTRFFSYYLVLIVCMIIIIFETNKKYKAK